MADPGSPDWWLDRLYKRLRDRQQVIAEWDMWYSGEHPAPAGYEKAGPVLFRLIDTTGLNTLAKVTDAAHERMHVEGFKVGGKINDDIWEIWQGNNFDAASRMVFQDMMSLSESYVLVDPNPNAAGYPTMTPEHPEQCITETLPGTAADRVGLKVYVDDTGESPLRYAYLYTADSVDVYAAPSRIGGWALKPQWEHQPSLSGGNPLGECPLVPFPNRPRLLRSPRPEWFPALSVQKRINKTLLDRMAMQDAGAFKAKWATGLQIPVDPATGEPVEPFKVAIDRLFVNENKDGKFGQFEAEDIRMMLQAVSDDVKHAAVLVATPPDQLLGEIVNVSEGGLEAARDSLTRRVMLHKDFVEEPLETTGRLTLKASGKDVPNVSGMTTYWREDDNVTLGAKADAAVKWSTLGVPLEALWERFLGAGPDEIKEWRRLRDEEATSDPIAAALLRDAGVIGSDEGA